MNEVLESFSQRFTPSYPWNKPSMAIVFGTKDAKEADLVSAGAQLSPWPSPVLSESPQLALGVSWRVGSRSREVRSFPGEIVVSGIFRADEGAGRRIGAVTDNLHGPPTASGLNPDCSAGPTSFAIFMHVW